MNINNEGQAPMTPEMQQAMMMQQGQPQGQPQQMMPQGAPAPQEEGASAEDIAEAKKMLGLDVMEQEMKYDKTVASTIQEFPALNKSTIESEIAKIEESDPAFAQQIRSSETGMKMFAKTIMASIKPDAKADDITDDSSSSASAEDKDLEEKIKNGNASKIELGKYLGKNMK